MKKLLHLSRVNKTSDKLWLCQRKMILTVGIALALLTVIFTAHPAFADDEITAAPTSAPVNAGGRWFWGVAAGAAPTLYGFGPSYNPGLGLNAHIGFTLDKTWSLFANLDSYSFSTNNTFGLSSQQTTLTPCLKYSFDLAGFKPYLFAGEGLNDNLFNTLTGTVNSFSLAYNVGAGMNFPLEKGLDLQIQAEYEAVIVVNNSYSYLPISAGLEFN
jgi:hypothetical protein